MEDLKKLNIVTNPAFEASQGAAHGLVSPLPAGLLRVTSNFSNMGDASLASSVCMGGDDYACESHHCAQPVLHRLAAINKSYVT